MRIRIARLLAASLFTWASVGAAQAALVQVSATWDLASQLAISPLDGGTVSIANGDHVVFNVDFLGTQRLNFADGGEFLWTALWAGDNLSMFTIDNIALDLLGFSGTGGAASSYSMATETNGAAHLGPTWNDFLAAGQTVSFNGFAVEFDVQSISLSPHLYSNTFLFYGGDNVTVSTAAEPGTLALFGLGFATLAATRRRRRH